MMLGEGLALGLVAWLGRICVRRSKCGEIEFMFLRSKWWPELQEGVREEEIE
ncbi:hypothetical protein TIFTF001_033621 [Ficus carica]|uniref:Uncharacterized protein n=1 Tax=Ficus carica TaxID=3494 RepID=A0AA88E137_FICCA|nr:hypothetical protein TIFTF001_033621 [Ficus carica]